MENEMVPKYLAACKLAGMSEGSIKIAAATLESFAEYCKKQAQAKKEKERLRSAFLLDGRRPGMKNCRDCFLQGNHCHHDFDKNYPNGGCNYFTKDPSRYNTTRILLGFLFITSGAVSNNASFGVIMFLVGAWLVIGRD